MLNDAGPKYFAAIYIVCGYTDLRYGIDSLAAIIECKYKVSLICFLLQFPVVLNLLTLPHKAS